MTIKENKHWSVTGLRDMCIRHNLYNRGTNEAYNNLLDSLMLREVTIQEMYEVAKNILEHTEDNTIENVMFLLNREAINTFYEIEE